MQPLPPSPSASASLLPPTAPPPPSEELKSPDGSDGRFASMVAQASQVPTPPPPPPKKDDAEEKPASADAPASVASGSDSKGVDATPSTGSTPPQKPVKPAVASAAEPAAKTEAPIPLATPQIVAQTPLSLPVQGSTSTETQHSEVAATPASAPAPGHLQVPDLPSSAAPETKAPPTESKAAASTPLPAPQALGKDAPRPAVPADPKPAPSASATKGPIESTSIDLKRSSLPTLPPSEPKTEATAPPPSTPGPIAPKAWVQVQAAVEPSDPAAVVSPLPNVAMPASARTSNETRNAPPAPEDVRPALRVEAPPRLRETAAVEVEPAKQPVSRDAVKEASASRDAGLSLETQKAAPKIEPKAPAQPMPTSSMAAPSPTAAKTEAPVLPPAPNAATPQLEAGVKWMLRTGTQEAQLQLHPESLGQVSIHLKVEGSSVHAKVWVAEAGSVQALQDGKAHLELSLRHQGLQLGSFDLQQGRQPAQRGFEAPVTTGASPVNAAPPGAEPTLALPAPPPSRRLELIA
jgi:hypothetical protein